MTLLASTWLCVPYQRFSSERRATSFSVVLRNGSGQVGLLTCCKTGRIVQQSGPKSTSTCDRITSPHNSVQIEWLCLHHETVGRVSKIVFPGYRTALAALPWVCHCTALLSITFYQSSARSFIAESHLKDEHGYDTLATSSPQQSSHLAPICLCCTEKHIPRCGVHLGKLWLHDAGSPKH